MILVEWIERFAENRIDYADGTLYFNGKVDFGSNALYLVDTEWILSNHMPTMVSGKILEPEEDSDIHLKQLKSIAFDELDMSSKRKLRQKMLDYFYSMSRERVLSS